MLENVTHSIFEPGATGGHLSQLVAFAPPTVVRSLLERRGTGPLLPWAAQYAITNEPLQMKSRERAIVDLASVSRACR